VTRLVGLIVAVLLLGGTTGEPAHPGQRVPDPGITPTVGPVPMPRWQIVVGRDL